jgi:ABC-type multidrug transport system fused ATPase/permease subunit
MVLRGVFWPPRYIPPEAGTHFVAQQKNLGAINGYIEERMNGQKVVKVFCHEEKCREEFKDSQRQLFDSSYNANRYANSHRAHKHPAGQSQLRAVHGGWAACWPYPARAG